MNGIAGKLPSQSYFSPLADNYANKGTKSLTPADTGQDWFMAEGATDARMTIINGKLTNADTASKAGYAQANLGANVTHLGGTFTLRAGTGGANGRAAFIVWQTPMLNPAIVPNTGCHLTIGETTWSFGVYEDGVLTTLNSGAFVEALTCDDETVYSCDIALSGTTATIDLPDGAQQVITDARIASLAGYYVCYETYQTSTTDIKAKFISVYGNTE